jgi:ubiquinone/menaquinone biosynthesis C-methylase UbiE
MAFHDVFSDRSSEYAAQRPTYPDGLFAFIAERAPSKQAAWDCATGNGQAAVGLVRHFTRVEATDASAAQLAHALPAPRVRYSVQPAEQTTFADGAFDALCVAQSLHWFDFDRFFAEATRVLKPGGVFAAWGYDRFTVTPTFDAAFQRRVLDVLAGAWPEQNRMLWNGYRDVPMPFAPIEAPAFHIDVHWTLEQLVGYVGTWSATKRYLAESHPEWLGELRDQLRSAWPGSGPARVAMPLHLLCGRRA